MADTVDNTSKKLIYQVWHSGSNRPKDWKKEGSLRQMFDGFNAKAYFANEPKNKEDDWELPQGKEDF